MLRLCPLVAIHVKIVTAPGGTKRVFTEQRLASLWVNAAMALLAVAP